MPEFISLLRWIRDTAYPTLQGYVSTVAGYVTTASNYKDDAEISATNASTSEENASTSESNALASAQLASDYAGKAEDSEVVAGKYSALHYAAKSEASAIASESSKVTSVASSVTAQLRMWEAESFKLTAESYSNEAHNVPVKIYTSNGDGTFTSADTNPIEYSALHWKDEANAAAQGDAENISFNNTGISSLSTNLQDSTSEIFARVDSNDSSIASLNNYKITSKSSVLKGYLDLSNTIWTTGFSSTLYTGQTTSTDDSYQGGAGGTFNYVTDILLVGHSVWNNTAGNIVITYYNENGSTDTLTVPTSSMYINTGISMSGGKDYSSLGDYSPSVNYDIGDESTFTREGRVIRVIALKANGPSTSVYDPSTMYDMSAMAIDDTVYDYWQIKSETNGALFQQKARNTAYSNHWYDAVRGNDKYIITDSSAIEEAPVGYDLSFTTNGVILGTGVGINGSDATFVAWTHQTTNIISGRTSHGKPYIEEYNPITGFSIILDLSSGLAGHQVPHSLGGADFVIRKNLDSATAWRASREAGKYINFGLQDAETPDTTMFTGLSNDYIEYGSNTLINTSNNRFITYIFRNAYEDEDGNLNGIYETKVYSGTSISNYIETKEDVGMFATRRLDSTGNFLVRDILRDDGVNDTYLLYNLPNVEEVDNTARGGATIVENGITELGAHSDENISGGLYLLFVVYDNDVKSGKSKYTLTTDTTQVQANDLLVSYSCGVDNSGTYNTLEYIGTKTMTIVEE